MTKRTGTIRPYDDSPVQVCMIIGYQVPITQNMKLNDVCVYKQGDVNKTGKEGKTSWDTSHALLMNQHLYTHPQCTGNKQTI